MKRKLQRLLVFVQVAGSRWAYTSLVNREPKETKPVVRFVDHE